MELELESLRKELGDKPLECLRNGSADCDLFGGVKQPFLAKVSSPVLLHLLVGEGTTDADVGLSGETLLVPVTIELIPVPQQGVHFGYQVNIRAAVPEYKDVSA